MLYHWWNFLAALFECISHVYVCVFLGWKCPALLPAEHYTKCKERGGGKEFIPTITTAEDLCVVPVAANKLVWFQEPVSQGLILFPTSIYWVRNLNASVFCYWILAIQNAWNKNSFQNLTVLLYGQLTFHVLVECCQFKFTLTPLSSIYEFQIFRLFFPATFPPLASVGVGVPCPWGARLSPVCEHSL